eukprot:3378892-Pyramimonas_sp.AAC.1
MGGRGRTSDMTRAHLACPLSPPPPPSPLLLLILLLDPPPLPPPSFASPLQVCSDGAWSDAVMEDVM